MSDIEKYYRRVDYRLRVTQPLRVSQSCYCCGRAIEVVLPVGTELRAVLENKDQNGERVRTDVILKNWYEIDGLWDSELSIDEEERQYVKEI